MLHRLYEYVLNHPAVLGAIARVLWNASCLGLLAGVLAAAVNAILGVVTSMNGVEAGYQSLMSGLATWWIPESTLGVGFYLCIMLAAYTLNDLACELKRFHKY